MDGLSAGLYGSVWQRHLSPFDAAYIASQVVEVDRVDLHRAPVTYPGG